jgi:pimeloyl-ACP methyl ester carboxylesterase
MASQRRCLGRPVVVLCHERLSRIAHDRRGHGRSTQTSEGNNIDTYADDLANLTRQLDLKDAIHVYGANRQGAKISQGLRDAFWLMSMQAGHKSAYECIKAFSETDLTEDLTKIDVSTLIVHGDDDQIVPIADSALLSAKLVKGATLKIYAGAPHGLTATHKDQLNADLFAFAQA